jgi:hypothetical protein
MTDDEPKPWLRALVTGLTAYEWIGKAGRLFRRTGEAVERYNEEQFHADEKMQQLPEIVWLTAQTKSSQVERNIAEVEEKKIANEQARKVMDAKVRQENAAADIAEINKQLVEIQLANARIDLLMKLKDAGVAARFSEDGNITVSPAPKGYDFDSLRAYVHDTLVTVELVETAPTFPTSFIIERIEEQPKQLGTDTPVESPER